LLLVRLLRNDSILHYLLLIVLFAAFRILLFLQYPEALPEEISFIEIGKRLQEGDLLYKDLWVSTSPLSASVYWLLSLLDDFPLFAFRLVAAALGLWVLLRFNALCMQLRLYNQRHVLTGFFMAVFFNAHPAFLVLSPELIAMPALTWVIYYSIRQIEEGTQKSYLLEAGFFMSLAMLAHLPYGWLIPACIFAYFLYSNTNITQQLSFVFTASMPLLLVVLFFYWRGEFSDMATHWLLQAVQPARSVFLNTDSMLRWGTSLALCAAVFLIGTWQSPQFINYQVRAQMTFFWMGIAAFLLFWFGDFKQWYNFYLLLTIVAFYAAHYLLLLKRKWIQELCAWILPLWGGSLLFFGTTITSSHTSPVLQVQMPGSTRVWVIGYDYEWYRHYRSATPFFDYELSRRYLDQLDHYGSCEGLARVLLQSPPALIVDSMHRWEEISKRIPLLAAHYRPTEVPHVYRYAPQTKDIPRLRLVD